MWQSKFEKVHVNSRIVLDRQKYDAAWAAKFRELQEFKAEFGHCNVKQIYESLGPWVSTQRANYAKRQLPKDRIEALESIGFEWLLRDSPATAWQKNFEALRDFSRINGHCNPVDDVSLRRWATQQRNRYSKLTRERVEQLNSIGFDWEKPVEPPKVKASSLAQRLKTAAKSSRILLEQGISRAACPWSTLAF
jgi:hypothetical protein